MKNFLFILFSFFLLSVGLVLTAQTDSTAIDPVLTPIEQSSVYTFMFAAALAGVVLRIIISTAKAVKNNPATPITFDWVYWLKDNALPKITVALTFILTFTAQFKLPGTLTGVVILCILSFGAGWAIDWVGEILTRINPKTAKA